jgi:hypothetical protein
MGSRQNIFDPLDLEIIDRVYEAIWAQIVSRQPDRDRSRAAEGVMKRCWRVFPRPGVSPKNLSLLAYQRSARRTVTAIAGLSVSEVGPLHCLTKSLQRSCTHHSAQWYSRLV